MAHPLAGKPAPTNVLTDIPALLALRARGVPLGEFKEAEVIAQDAFWDAVAVVTQA